MRFLVNDDHNRPFEILSSEDLKPSKRGWYFIKLGNAEQHEGKVVGTYDPPRGYVPMESYFNGPFGTLDEAFVEAVFHSTGELAWGPNIW